MTRIWPELGGFAPDIVEQLEIDAQYAGYLDRQDADILAFRRDEGRALPAGLDYRRRDRPFQRSAPEAGSASAPPPSARPPVSKALRPPPSPWFWPMSKAPEGAKCLTSFGPEEFAGQTGVSRETLARLKAYAGLLTDWNARHNLVARSSLDDLWQRHFWDRAQLAPLIPDNAKTLADLGSGAGFPGLVLAECCRDRGRDPARGHRQEMRFPARRGRAHGPARHHRECPDGRSAPQAFDVVTARACAPLPQLLGLCPAISQARTAFACS